MRARVARKAMLVGAYAPGRTIYARQVKRWGLDKVKFLVLQAAVWA